jgi:hypothetical protein
MLVDFNPHLLVWPMVVICPGTPRELLFTNIVKARAMLPVPMSEPVWATGVVRMYFVSMTLMSDLPNILSPVRLIAKLINQASQAIIS